MRTKLWNSKVALVTGAVSGIGANAVTELVRQGAKVAAIDTDKQGLDRLTAAEPATAGFVCDVTNATAVRQAVKEAERVLGAIDTVIHCAGICQLGRLVMQPASTIDNIMRVNYLGTVHIAQATVPQMIERRHGGVAFIASIGGWLPMADAGAYNASKAAVVSLCETLAAECRGSGVRITCLAPPAVETPMLQEIRTSHPQVVNVQQGLPPAAVTHTALKSLARGRLHAFPGRGTSTLWRARRFAPDLLSGLIEARLKNAH